MFENIWFGLVCAFCLIAFAVGGLGLLLGIGHVLASLMLTVIGGAGLVVFSGLIGE